MTRTQQATYEAIKKLVLEKADIVELMQTLMLAAVSFAVRSEEQEDSSPEATDTAMRTLLDRCLEEARKARTRISAGVTQPEAKA